ncbi:hypothetical protein BD769DRAFT_1402897 [Suillus cothurnatus]|nr:hypothetical protein BD769DRAFT_1402897 [Suillus cothurnatus]
MAPLMRLVRTQSLRVPQQRIRRYSSTTGPRSAHSEWYASMLPGMVPVALLGSAVYLVSSVVLVSWVTGFLHGFPSRHDLESNVSTSLLILCFVPIRGCSYYGANWITRNF